MPRLRTTAFYYYINGTTKMPSSRRTKSAVPVTPFVAQDLNLRAVLDEFFPSSIRANAKAAVERLSFSALTRRRPLVEITFRALIGRN